MIALMHLVSFMQMEYNLILNTIVAPQGRIMSGGIKIVAHKYMAICEITLLEDLVIHEHIVFAIKRARHWIITISNLINCYR